MAVDTLARLFWDRVEQSGARPAQQFKQGGVWKTITWRETGGIGRGLAVGLVGLGRGEGGTGARTIIVEDPSQLAKVLEAQAQIPQLEHIVVMSGYDAPQPPKKVMTWATLRRLGRESEAAHKSTLADRVASTRPEDVATIVYTSGTTGPPKGVVQTHANHIAAVNASKQSTPPEEGWVHLLFLPLAPSFARLQ